MSSENVLASQRKRYHKRKKLPKPSVYDQYSYKAVPNTWRDNLVITKYPEREIREINSPLVLDLLKGKTILVDYTLPYSNKHPFRSLYGYCSARGYRLRVHVVDIADKEEFRKLLMWTEPIKPIKYPKEKVA